MTSTVAEPIQLSLRNKILFHNLLLLVHVEGRHVGLGYVFVSSFVISSDSHLMNLFQDLSAVLNAKLLKKLFDVLRPFTLSQFI